MTASWTYGAVGTRRRHYASLCFGALLTQACVGAVDERSEIELERGDAGLTTAALTGSTIQAECAHGNVGACGGAFTGSRNGSSCSNGAVGTCLENSNTTVGYFDSGDWLLTTASTCPAPSASICVSPRAQAPAVSSCASTRATARCSAATHPQAQARGRPGAPTVSTSAAPRAARIRCSSRPSAKAASSTSTGLRWSVRRARRAARASVAAATAAAEPAQTPAATPTPAPRTRATATA